MNKWRFSTLYLRLNEINTQLSPYFYFYSLFFTTKVIIIYPTYYKCIFKKLRRTEETFSLRRWFWREKEIQRASRKHVSNRRIIFFFSYCPHHSGHFKPWQEDSWKTIATRQPSWRTGYIRQGCSKYYLRGKILHQSGKNKYTTWYSHCRPGKKVELLDILTNTSH